MSDPAATEPDNLARPALGLVVTAVCVYVAALTVTVLTLHWVGPVDDAFIAEVYARNLARGDGLVFDGGPPVWGFTSPLHVGVLALLAALGAPVGAAAIALSLALVVPIAVLGYRLLCRVTGRPGVAAACVLLLAVGGPLFNPDLWALESNLLIALELWLVWLALTHRPAAAALVGALCVLTRPDAVLLVLPVLWATRAQHSPRTLAGLLLPGALWLGFCGVYYGAWWPHTLTAKVGVEPVAASLWRRLVLLVSAPAPAIWGLPVAGAALVKLVGVGAFVWRERRRPAVVGVLVGYPLVLVVAYGLFGAPAYHVWEVAPAHAFWATAACLGLVTGAADAARKLVPRHARAITRGAVLLVCAAGIAHTLARAHAWPDGFFQGRRLGAYRDIGSWLDAHAPPASRVLVGEVGTIRFFAPRRDLVIVDAAGITHALPHGSDVAATLRHYRIDYLLVPADAPPARYVHVHDAPDLAFAPVHTFADTFGFRAHVLYRVTPTPAAPAPPARPATDPDPPDPDTSATAPGSSRSRNP